MKKLYFLIIFAMIIFTANAQITLTSSTSIPQIGSSFNYIIVTSPSLNLQQGGNNTTWDLSSLSGSAEIISYISLANSQGQTLFPNAALVETDGSGNFENFYASSNSELSYEGHLLSGMQVIYTDKRELIKFPITYNTTFNETFAGTASMSGITLIRGGTTEIKADGYGTLILPYTTVNDVLRVRLVVDYTDSYMGSQLGQYNDTIYMWYNLQTQNRIASYTIAYMNGAASLTSASYISQANLVTSVDDLILSENKVNFYPNPASDYIFIKNDEAVKSLEIHDVSGRTVQTHQTINNNKIDISNLNSGIYFIKYETGSGKFVEKLSVNK